MQKTALVTWCSFKSDIFNLTCWFLLSNVENSYSHRFSKNQRESGFIKYLFAYLLYIFIKYKYLAFPLSD